MISMPDKIQKFDKNEYTVFIIFTLSWLSQIP